MLLILTITVTEYGLVGIQAVESMNWHDCAQIFMVQRRTRRNGRVHSHSAARIPTALKAGHLNRSRLFGVEGWKFWFLVR
jgi:hypothetical protein